MGDTYLQYLQNYAYAKGTGMSNEMAAAYGQQQMQQSSTANAQTSSYDESRSSNYNRSGDDRAGNRGGGYNQQRTNNYDGNNDYRNTNRNQRDYGAGSSGTSGGGGGGSSSHNSDMSVQRDTIFIQNLPKTITEDEIIEKFGSIGIIKKDKRTNNLKIWIYKDKSTGESKGEATVTYDDEMAAGAAIDWFNEKEVFGNIVKVQLATRKSSVGGFRGGRGGGRGGGGGGYNRGGDRGGGGGGGDRDRGGSYRGSSDRYGSDRRDRGGSSGGGGGGGYSRPKPY